MDIISKNIYSVRDREGSQGVFISSGTEDTNKIAKNFAKEILKGTSNSKKGATVVGLYGDLGAGKTTFMQFLAKEFGIKRKVNSPTYVIIKNYELRITNFKRLFHIDAYRLKNEKELLHLGWEEMIANPENLILIEWPEKIKKAMPKNHHQIHISHLSTRKKGVKEEHRKFKIKTI